MRTIAVVISALLFAGLAIADPAPQPTSKLAGTKTCINGWELYMGQDTGEMFYALMYGTNRNKESAEIKRAAVKDLDGIKRQLDEIKQGQSVTFSLSDDRVSGDRPPAGQVRAVAEYCRKIGLIPRGGSLGDLSTTQPSKENRVPAVLYEVPEFGIGGLGGLAVATTPHYTTVELYVPTIGLYCVGLYLSDGGPRDAGNGLDGWITVSVDKAEKNRYDTAKKLKELMISGTDVQQLKHLFATQPAATQPSQRAADRAEKLKADVKTFTLSLDYHGQQDKPYYHLLLRVPPLTNAEKAAASDHLRSPFFLLAQITEDEAKAIIDHLAVEGFLDNAMEGNRNAGPVPPKGPYYALAARVENKGNPVVYEEWLSLDLKMLHRFDGLRKVLKGDAGKGMDLLLERMAGHRKEWEKQAASKPAA